MSQAATTPTITKETKAPKKKRSLGARNNLIAYSFIAPNFIGFAIFTLIPMVFSLILSFMDWHIISDFSAIKFVGFDNFVKLFQDPAFTRALLNTVVYTVLTVPTTLVCALALALLLNSKIKGRNFFRTISFFPYVASLVAVATVWRFIFSPEVGPLNQILTNVFSMESGPKWTSDPAAVMFFVVFFSVWKNMGYYMVIYLAGLQGVNTELYEAAALDGASKWQRFRNVTIPQISPTTFFVLMMLIINSFKVYDIFLNLFAGGDNQLSNSTRVIVYQIYNTAFRSTDYGYSSAMAMILFLIVLAVTLVQFWGESKYGTDK